MVQSYDINGGLPFQTTSFIIIISLYGDKKTKLKFVFVSDHQPKTKFYFDKI